VACTRSPALTKLLSKSMHKYNSLTSNLPVQTSILFFKLHLTGNSAKPIYAIEVLFKENKQFLRLENFKKATLKLIKNYIYAEFRSDFSKIKFQ